MSTSQARIRWFGACVIALVCVSAVCSMHVISAHAMSTQTVNERVDKQRKESRSLAAVLFSDSASFPEARSVAELYWRGTDALGESGGSGGAAIRTRWRTILHFVNARVNSCMRLNACRAIRRSAKPRISKCTRNWSHCVNSIAKPLSKREMHSNSLTVKRMRR